MGREGGMVVFGQSSVLTKKIRRTTEKDMQRNLTDDRMSTSGYREEIPFCQVHEVLKKMRKM